MKAEVFDKKFDDNEVDIVGDLDFSTMKRPNQSKRQLNVDVLTNPLDEKSAVVCDKTQSTD